jgi:hypothetical protein
VYVPVSRETGRQVVRFVLDCRVAVKWFVPEVLEAAPGRLLEQVGA